MTSRFDEIKGKVVGGKLRVTEWPKPRVSNPHLLGQEFDRYMALCDCQHPDTTPDGFAAVSVDCPIHGDRGRRTIASVP